MRSGTLSAAVGALLTLCFAACAEDALDAGGSKRPLPAGSLAEFIAQLLDQEGWHRDDGVAAKLIKIGAPAVDPLCKQLDDVDGPEVAGRICHTLGEIGDPRALPAVLQFIDRDIDARKKKRKANAAKVSSHYTQDWFPGKTSYKWWILPAVAALGDERALPTLVRLREWMDGLGGTNFELTEPVFAELKLEASIPVVTAAFCSGKSTRRSDGATGALLAIGVPVVEYLLRDWDELDAAERVRRMRMLVFLADERRSEYMVGRLRPKVADQERALAVLRLAEDDLQRLFELAGDADRRVRFHLAQLLQARLLYHKDDAESQRVLAALAEDADPSVKFAATEQVRSRTRYRLGILPRREFDPPGGDFAVQAKPLKHGDLSIELALNRAEIKLDAPAYRFNQPAWLRLRIHSPDAKPAPADGDGEQVPPRRFLTQEPPARSADVRSVSLVLWDAHGKETRRSLFRIGRDERCYISPSINLIQYSQQAERTDFSEGYVNLIEAAELGPGNYVIAVEYDRQLGGRVEFSVSSSVVDQRPLVSDRERFNPFAENRFAEVKWRTLVGGPVPRGPAVIGKKVVFTSVGKRVLALSKQDGSTAWSFDSVTGRIFDMRMIDGQIVVETWLREPEDSDQVEIFELVIDAANGKVLEQREIAKLTNPPGGRLQFQKGGFEYRREVRFGDRRRSYLVADDGTVALWSGAEIVRRFGTGDNGWWAASHDGDLLFGGFGKTVRCYDVAKGKQLWRTDGIRLSVMKRDGDTLYATARGYGPVRALDPGTGKLKWSFPQGANQGMPPAVDRSVLYAGSWHGDLWAIDANNGGLLWRLKANSSGNIWTAAAADGIVYYAGGDGFFYAVENQAVAR